jgi:hypothetical protein
VTVEKIKTDFMMKVADNTPNGDIRLSLYDAPDGGGILIDKSKSMSASDFTSDFESGYNFKISGLSLLGPGNYSLVLWSDSTQGSFRIKSNVTSSDPTEVPLGGIPGVPEPSTVLSASLIAGLMGLGYFWRRRQRIVR